MKKRTDQNQSAIIQLLRSIGCSVQDLSQLGKGCPDLLVGYRQRNYLVEIKNATDRAPRLTPAEEIFIRGWKGQVAVITTIEDALAVILDESFELEGGEYDPLTRGRGSKSSQLGTDKRAGSASEKNIPASGILRR